MDHVVEGIFHCAWPLLGWELSIGQKRGEKTPAATALRPRHTGCFCSKAPFPFAIPRMRLTTGHAGQGGESIEAVPGKGGLCLMVKNSAGNKMAK